jgi:hypothetical protein
MKENKPSGLRSYWACLGRLKACVLASVLQRKRGHGGGAGHIVSRASDGERANRDGESSDSSENDFNHG